MLRQRWPRFLVVPLIVLAFLAVPASAPAPVARAAIQAFLRQCHSGGYSSVAPYSRYGAGPCIWQTGGDVKTGWDPGAINDSNSWYRAGDFVPMRTVLYGLTAGGTYTLRIEYIAFKGFHSYDYLGAYNASVFPRGLLRPPENPPPHRAVIPCGGVAGTQGTHPCRGRPSTWPVPPDEKTTFPGGGHPAGGRFSAWGATFEAAGYDDCAGPPAKDCGPISASTPTGGGTTIYRQINLTFKVGEGNDAQSTVVLAWGAHIATALRWGYGRTEAEVGSGADAFKVDLVELNGPDVTGNPTGGETVSLNVAGGATGRLDDFTTRVTFTPNPPTTVLVGQPVTDTATLTARRGAPVTGHVRFFVCSPPTATGCPPPSGTAVGTADVIPQSPGSPNGVASIPFAPPAAGRYCFRAELLREPAGFYSPAYHTNAAVVGATTNPNPECFDAVGGRLTVTKLCDDPTDTGHFNLLVDGQPWGGTAGENVPCGGSAGPFPTSPGTKTVSETAGTGTTLTDFDQPTFGGNCVDNGNGTGSINVPVGLDVTCEITNRRIVPPPPDPDRGLLTLTKACVPANDPGRFEFRVDGAPVVNLSCGQSTTEPIRLAPDVAHTVSEVGSPPTSLSDYTTVISGPCAPGGSITLAPGQTASCTFTNTRIPATTPATLRVDKACVPPGDRGRFNLTINGNVAGTGSNVGCGGTTGAVQVSPGSYKVGETGAGGTGLANYAVAISGDCNADGTITVAAGQQAVCRITNVRGGVRPPPGLVCYTLDVARRMVTGGPVRIVARVHLHGRGVPGIRVYAVGPGVSVVGVTGPTGHAVFLLRIRRPGVLLLTIRRPFLCPPPHGRAIGILGVSQPSLTG